MIKNLKNILVLLFIIIFALSNISFSISDPNSFEPTTGYSDDTSELERIVGIVLQVIRVVAVIFSVVGISIIGFKIMLGSIEEKSEYKQKLIPFIIGCVILVSSTIIVQLLYNVINARQRVPKPKQPIDIEHPLE